MTLTREEGLKTAKPILFNTDMVRAIQNGTKKVTRRIVKPKYTNTIIILKNRIPFETAGTSATTVEIKSPYQVGDILYVRETWCKLTDWEEQYPDSEEDMQIVYYKSDYPADMLDMAKWHPSIHMPKDAARIFLRVTCVRVERLPA